MKKLLIASGAMAAVLAASTAFAATAPKLVEYSVFNKTPFTAKVTATIHGTQENTITLIPGAANVFELGPNGQLAGDTLKITYYNADGTKIKTTQDEIVARYNNLKLFPNTYEIPGATLLTNHNNVPYAQSEAAYKYDFVIKNQQL